MPVSAVIFGCAAQRLSQAERDFFRDADPLGFILFARNVERPDQVRRLVAELREAVGRGDAPVLIDQEGGRVARLRPPHWRAAPPAARFGALAEIDPAAASEAARLNARLLAGELAELGITVDCAPVLDLRFPGAHDVIGDRAFGSDPDLVAALGRATAEGLMEGGIVPVVKHAPGHGRACADTHAELPVVTTPAAELEATDFRPFKALHDLPWAMTAHVVFSAFDPDRPATTSPRVVREVIRGRIGFRGVLISDDLSMRALGGSFSERAAAVLGAGCDLVLHCNGNPQEMREVMMGASPLSAAAAERVRVGFAMLQARREPAPGASLLARLESLLQRVAA